MSSTQLNVAGVPVSATTPLPVTGTFSATTAGQYNTTLPTYTNGQTTQLQTDSNGRLLITSTINAVTAATYNSTPPTFSSGSSNAMQSDTNGNLMVTQRIGNAAIGPQNAIPVYDAYTAPVSVNWTSATALNTTATVTTAGMDNVVFTLACPSTITSGSVTFEVYDGVNWIVVKSPRISSYGTETTAVLGTSFGTQAWQVPVGGFPQARARLSAVLVGTGNVGVTNIVSSVPDVSIVTCGIDPGSTLPAFATPPTVNINSGQTIALSAGSAAIGTVTLSALPALVAGSASIGSVVTSPSVGSGSINSNQVSVGTTATLVAAARTGAQGTGRIAITIINSGTAPVFVGASGVTTGTGVAVAVGASITINTTAAIYSVCASGTQTVSFLETF